MREFLKSCVRYAGIGWFWVVVLLVLPNCKFDPHILNSPNLNPGNTPHSSVIFCDIEQERHCASPEEMTPGAAIYLREAALALNDGTGTNIGLDDSPDALGRCSNQPEAVIFRGHFPKGFAVCVNCGDVVGTATYPNVDAACVARCEDFFGTIDSDGTVNPNNPPHDEDRTFCEQHALASTNFPKNGCFPDACTGGGMLNSDFVDPRQDYEPIVWRDTDGVIPTGAGNSLIRNKPFTGMFDAGAVSTQVIDKGDAFVEFTATEVNKTRLCGLSSGAPPDTDVSQKIGFAITLFNNAGSGDVDLFENGQLIGKVDTLKAGDRFRVKAIDNHNNTATIQYWKVTGPCNPGHVCAQKLLYQSLNTGTYPFRVDTSFFDQNATLTDVRLVRIH